MTLRDLAEVFAQSVFCMAIAPLIAIVALGPWVLLLWWLS